jgi:O-antigen ligase
MPTFLYQAMSMFGWGAMLVVMAKALPATSGPWSIDLKLLLAGLFVLLVAALATPWWTGQPISLALCAAAMIAAAVLAAVTGAALRRTGSGVQAFRALCIGILVAAMANACIAVVQIYAPSWIDGFWFASPLGSGRAAGNLRQSNHLCTLSLWGIVAVAWLGEVRALRQFTVAAIGVLLMFAVVLTASRSGLAGVMLLTLWGLLDRRLTRRTRTALLLAPVMYALLWAAVTVGAYYGHLVFDSGRRFSVAGALATSRFDVWANTLDLIRAHPWLGVGSGEFNLAWTLTEFPKRSGEFFHHAHNLPLHFAVELGLPLATLVMALFGWAFWATVRNCRRALADEAAVSLTRPAFAMLSFVLLHSMLELPLWYSYFLLPTAFLLGLCLTQQNRSDTVSPDAARSGGRTSNLRPAALALMLGAAFSVFDYLRVVPIFVPPPPNIASPLSERIAAGQRSLLFPYLADVGAAMDAPDPADALGAAKRAAHLLLNETMMVTFANALHAAGDTERAKYVAQRFNEFPSGAAQAYFAPCKDTNLTDAQRPYQCFAPQRKFTFEDFR